MCSPMQWSYYKGNKNTKITVQNTTYKYNDYVFSTVKFISRQFELESILNGNVTKDGKFQAYSMLLATIDNIDLSLKYTLDIDLYQ